jgi:hypothetical protein
MSRGPAVAVVLLLILVAWGLMYLGWRRRIARQSDIAAPVPPAPQQVSRAEAEGVEATYVSTTTAPDWLDRVAAHGLGTRSDARLLLDDDGLVVVRAGGGDLLLPVADLRAVRRESVRAGKAVAGRGLLVVDWQLGQTLVSTAFKARRDADRDELLTAITAVLPTQPGSTDTDTAQEAM